METHVVSRIKTSSDPHVLHLLLGRHCRKTLEIVNKVSNCPCHEGLKPFYISASEALRMLDVKEKLTCHILLLQLHCLFGLERSGYC